VTEAGTGGHSVGYYARVFRRRGWIVILTTALGLGAGYLMSQRQAAEYRASADIQVNTQDFTGGAASDISKDLTRIVATQAALAGSTKVADDAVTCAIRLYGAQQVAITNGITAQPATDCKLDTPPVAPGKEPTAAQKQVAAWEKAGGELFSDAKIARWTAQDAIDNSKISPDAETDIVHFSVSGPTKNIATWMANGYAVAFAQNSVDTERAKIEAAEKPYLSKRATYTGNMARLRTEITQRQNLGLDASDLQALYAVNSSSLESVTGLIQNLETQMATLPGASQLANPASKAAQTAPTTKRNLAAGGAIGLVIGLGLIFLLEALDRKVRSSEEVSEELGLGLLARIPAPSRKLRKKDDIALMVDTGGNHAEAYRKLRVALDFANLQARARVIMVTSAVEQEGKSTTIANLAVALAQVGRRVALVDLDLRRPYLNRFFDLEQVPGVTDVALGHLTLADAIHKIAVTPRTSSANGSLDAARTNGNGSHKPGQVEGVLDVLAAGSQPPDPVAFLESEAMGDIIAQLRERYDIVLIDAPPVLPVSDAMAISARVDGLVIVTRLEVVQKPMLRELRRELDGAHVARLGLVLTGADSDSDYGAGYGYGYGYGREGERQPSATRDNA
jgi:Mrp family chromosome partitioning ATPase/capsular polysaccharide biosynthesis protein